MEVTHEERLTPGEITELQEDAWRRTFEHASARSPFYREHFRNAGLPSGRAIPLADLAAIPTVDKTTLSSNAEAFVCVPRERIVDIVTTSGSTGTPHLHLMTEADLQRLALNEHHSFRCAGLTPADTVVLAVTLDRCFIAGMAYFMGLRLLGAGIARVGPATPVMHLEMMQRTRATAIVGVPSFLTLLADKASEAGIDPATFGVRSLICIGEPVRQADFSLNTAGAALARRWGARVFSTYGNTEIACSLCECEAGCGGHLHPELLHVETLDDDDRPVPEGEVGELTATTFGVEAMPLIRYRTGDYVAIHRARCRCGRHTLRIGPIVGRKNHKLKVKGATIFPSTLKTVLDATPGVGAFVIIARRVADLSDDVEVRVVCTEDPVRVTASLRERFQGEARVIPRITVASAEEIERLQMPEGARKRRFFADFRT